MGVYEQWRFTTGGVVESSPAVATDGTVYVGSFDRNLYAINANGSEQWRFSTGDYIKSSPAIGDDRTIYVGSFDNNLYAINPDGTEKWRFVTGNPALSSPAIGADGTIYAGSYDNNLYAINPDGTEKWRLPTGNRIRSSPAIGTDGTIYVGSFDNNLYAINPDGAEKWRFATGSLVSSSPAIGADSTIYISSYDNNLYAINPDGTEKWRFLTSGPVLSSPATGADGTIYVGSSDKNLYAINSDGSEQWRFPTGLGLFSSPAIGNDGIVYTGSYDNNLYAITGNSGGLADSPWPMFHNNNKHTGRAPAAQQPTPTPTATPSSTSTPTPSPSPTPTPSPSSWFKVFGGPGNDYGESVRQTTDGGFILAGYTFSSVVHSYEAYMIKTDGNGNEIWSETFGGSHTDIGESALETTDGGFILAGSTSSFGAGNSDMFIIKTDASGKSLWSKIFGGSDADILYSAEQTTDNGFILAGATYSSGAGSSDLYLIKTDEKGNEVWSETFGDTDTEIGESVQQTTDGGFIVVGTTISSAGDNEDVYLVKTDSSGNESWSKTFGGSGWDRGKSVRQTTDGGFIVTGYTYVSSLNSSNDIYLIKTDGNGNETWSKTFGGLGREEGRSVEQTTDDNFIVAGYTDSFGAGYDDLYLIKIDGNGNEIWSKTFGGSGREEGMSAEQTTDGGFIVIGYTDSFGAASDDLYLVKTDPNGN